MTVKCTQLLYNVQFNFAEKGLRMSGGLSAFQKVDYRFPKRRCIEQAKKFMRHHIVVFTCFAFVSASDEFNTHLTFFFRIFQVRNHG